MRNCPAGVAAVLIAGVMAMTTCVVGVAHGARSHTVVLRHIRFNPRKLVIGRGGTVRWVWRDGSIVHNVVSMSFRGSRAQSHGSFTVRFTRPGSFFYYCTIHAGMTGTIVVR
jgi:plastocyanin